MQTINLNFHFVAASEGKAEHAGNISDEPVAGREAARHRRLGRGGTARAGQSALRRPRRGHHNVRQRPRQTGHVSQVSGRSRIRLGLLREPVAHTLLSQVR